MTLIKNILLISVASLLIVTSAQAYSGKSYASLKVGQITMDNQSSGYNNKEMSYAANIGYVFHKGIGIEGEWLTSGNIAEDNVDLGTITNVDVETFYKSLGLYATYKQSIPKIESLYVKGKVGYATSSITTEYSKTNYKSFEDDLVDSSGFAYGVGVGFHVKKDISVELEYAALPKIDYLKNKNLTVVLTKYFN